MSESAELRNCVVGASFFCNTTEGDDLAAKVVELLKASEKFRHLHFAPFGALDSSLITPVLNVVTSLEIRFDHLGPTPGSDSVPMDRCYEIFCLPGLRSLAIILVRSWTRRSSTEASTEAERSKSSSRWRTSKITCLSLLATVRPGPDLVEMLSWPVCLQSLHYQLATDGGSELNTPAIDFRTVLETQKICLEELVVYGCYHEDDDQGYMVTEVIDLCSFGKLRVVVLDIRYMLVRESKLDADADDADAGASVGVHTETRKAKAICEMLPPSLEHLQLQLGGWSEGLPPEDTVIVCDDIGNVLEGIVRNRRYDGVCKGLKGLKSMMMWYPIDCDTEEICLWKFRGFEQLLDCAGGAGIEVSGWVGREPALF